MKNFGQIKNVMLIGGGYLMYYFAKIANYHKLPYKSVLAYCKKWEKKKLIIRY